MFPLKCRVIWNLLYFHSSRNVGYNYIVALKNKYSNICALCGSQWKRSFWFISGFWSALSVYAECKALSKCIRPDHILRIIRLCWKLEVRCFVLISLSLISMLHRIRSYTLNNSLFELIWETFICFVVRLIWLLSTEFLWLVLWTLFFLERCISLNLKVWIWVL